MWWLKGDSSWSQGHEKCKTDIVRASGLGVLDLLSINEKKEVKAPAECNKSARCPLRCNHKDKLFAREGGLRRLRSRGKGCFNVAREEDRGSRRSCCYSARLGKFGSKDLLVELLWVKVLPSLYTSWDISPCRCRSSLSGNATVNLSFPNFVTICRDNLNLIYMHN